MLKFYLYSTVGSSPARRMLVGDKEDFVYTFYLYHFKLRATDGHQNFALGFESQKLFCPLF